MGRDVEVVLTPPPKNPHAFPFAHKKILADRMTQYDLFVYSEDDTLITERNIEAFLKATEVLPADEIAGFLNTETDAQGNLYFCNVSFCYHWDPGSVRTRGAYTFAYFTNEHSAAYLLTRTQLGRAIKSGGFQVAPHEGRYDGECAASTDPYTQCGLKKMVCLSSLDDFLIRHLPGIKFASRPYAARTEFQKQIDALLEIRKHGRPRILLFDPETKILHAKWSKDYYEPVRSEILSLMPQAARSVLSIGCGWGAMEGHLVRKGLRVVGVPMDSVIAACAEAKGVEMVYGDFKTAREKLANESFDCIFLSDVLHLVRDPVAVLSPFVELLSPQCVVIAIMPNLGPIRIGVGRSQGKPQYQELGSYEKTGLRATSARLVRKWFKDCRLKVERVEYMIPPRAEFAHRLLGRLADPLVGDELIAIGRTG
jgi:2-polyprenyl-3-methyl-5-hydroxy-6-metoxy-1,4-benzoquinol methylase